MGAVTRMCVNGLRGCVSEDCVRKYSTGWKALVVRYMLLSSHSPRCCSGLGHRDSALLAGHMFVLLEISPHRLARERS